MPEEVSITAQSSKGTHYIQFLWCEGRDAEGVRRLLGQIGPCEALSG